MVVIPAFNESENIEKVLDDLNSIAEDYFSYIVVNDGSTDNTRELCEQKNIPVLNLPVNVGLSGAFRTGVKYAYRKGYDCVMQFDADGQHMAKYIPEMYSKLDEMQGGYDLVIGSRFMNSKKPFSPRMLGSRILATAIKITTGCTLSDPTSGMRIYGKQILKQLVDDINCGPEPDTIAYLLNKNMRFIETPIAIKERVLGKSYFNIVSSLVYMLRMTLSIFLIQWVRSK